MDKARSVISTALITMLILLSFTYSIAVSRARSDRNARIVCEGMFHNPISTARSDPVVIELCAEVGVSPRP